MSITPKTLIIQLISLKYQNLIIMLLLKKILMKLKIALSNKNKKIFFKLNKKINKIKLLSYS